MPAQTRRQFLQRLALRSETLSGASDSTLVCVFLRGGADTLNMFIPYADDTYYKIRPTISIPHPKSGKGSDSSVKLDDFYSLHPKMSAILPVYKEGRLAVVQAVGTDNPTGSHFETQDQMDHGDAFKKTAGGGWLARYLRARFGNNLTPLSAVSIGPILPESLRGAPGASAISSIDEIRIKAPCENPAVVAKVLTDLYNADVGLLSAPGLDTLHLLKRVESLRAIEYKPSQGASYPDSGFARGLREIARLIKADVGLEVACIDLDGWDTHFIQGSVSGLQAGLIETLSDSLAAFDTDLSSRRKQVTTLVITEFGRRSYENGSLGTDHGRGFAAMILGDGVRGGQILGHYPGLNEAKWVLGPAGLEVMFDYRSVLSEVLTKRMALQNSQDVFPGFQPQKIGIVRA
ncbi:MAG: hypothetical protein C0469_12450 [Cyanobacteria bacterium DS2.3.42]|nr:hypothetical protein [Cyanobacteria bacterium DS2.3.42]